MSTLPPHHHHHPHQQPPAKIAPFPAPGTHDLIIPVIPQRGPWPELDIEAETGTDFPEKPFARHRFGQAQSTDLRGSLLLRLHWWFKSLF